MFSLFAQGFRYPFRGLHLLLHPELRALVWLPILINTALFGFGLYWAGNSAYAQLRQWLSVLPDWLSWLSWLSWLIVPLFALSAILVLFYSFTAVANIIASPFNGVLAERVEDWVTNHQTPRPEQPWWRDVLYAPFGELRKLGYFIARALPLLLLLLIPGFNIFFPLLWGTFGAWMLALQYLDYPLANHGILFPAQRRIARQRPSIILGFGCGVLLMTIIPGLNFLSMPSAVIGASLLCAHERLPQSASRSLPS